jgi:glycosyltransferase involved in cell wall biosynthesis
VVSPGQAWGAARPRVGLVSAEFPPAIGGVGDHTARLARALAALGCAVEVLTSRSGAGAGAEQRPGGAWPDQPRVLRAVRRWDWRMLWQVWRTARERDWDVAHVQYQPAAYGLHGAVNALPLAWRAWRRGTRSARPALVTTFHDLRVPYLFPKAGPLRQAAVRLLAQASDAVIAVADDDLPRLKAWRRAAPPSTTEHVPLGNQLDAPPPGGFDPARWRAAAGVAPERLLVGYLGLTNRSKGVLELVDAAARRVAAGDDLELVMIGDQLGSADPTNAAYHAEVQAAIARHGLGPRVRWTGYLPTAEISAWLRALDLVALPFVDGASLRRTSLVAAWCQGAPVLTTTPLRPVSWLEDGRGLPAAWTVPPGDVPALAGALARLLGDPAARRALGESGRALAGRFAWPDVARRTLAVYAAAQAASGAARPPTRSPARRR